ncbi:MAG: hypothetical protein SGPRY_014987, partial [Prymnesium sp.]
ALLSRVRSQQQPAEEEDLSRENEELKQRVDELEMQLIESDRRWGYVIVKGMIVDAENVRVETMDVDEAKQFCNAHAECKGFTFGGCVCLSNNTFHYEDPNGLLDVRCAQTGREARR